MDAPVNANPRADNEGAIIIDMPSEGAPSPGTGDNLGDNNAANEGGGNGGEGRNVSEIRAVRPLLERVLPFALILLVKILYDHRLGKSLTYCHKFILEIQESVPFSFWHEDPVRGIWVFLHDQNNCDSSRAYVTCIRYGG